MITLLQYKNNNYINKYNINKQLIIFNKITYYNNNNNNNNNNNI